MVVNLRKARSQNRYRPLVEALTLLALLTFAPFSISTAFAAEDLLSTDLPTEPDSISTDTVVIDETAIDLPDTHAETFENSTLQAVTGDLQGDDLDVVVTDILSGEGAEDMSASSIVTGAYYSYVNPENGASTFASMDVDGSDIIHIWTAIPSGLLIQLQTSPENQGGYGFSAAGLPSGLTLNYDTGAITQTGPLLSSSYTVTVYVDDKIADAIVQTFSFVINIGSGDTKQLADADIDPAAADGTGPGDGTPEMGVDVTRDDVTADWDSAWFDLDFTASGPVSWKLYIAVDPDSDVEPTWDIRDAGTQNPGSFNFLTGSTLTPNTGYVYYWEANSGEFITGRQYFTTQPDPAGDGTGMGDGSGTPDDTGMGDGDDGTPPINDANGDGLDDATGTDGIVTGEIQEYWQDPNYRFYIHPENPAVTTWYRKNASGVWEYYYRSQNMGTYVMWWQLDANQNAIEPSAGWSDLSGTNNPPQYICMYSYPIVDLTTPENLPSCISNSN